MIRLQCPSAASLGAKLQMHALTGSLLEACVYRAKSNQHETWAWNWNQNVSISRLYLSLSRGGKRWKGLPNLGVKMVYSNVFKQHSWLVCPASKFLKTRLLTHNTHLPISPRPRSPQLWKSASAPWQATDTELELLNSFKLEIWNWCHWCEKWEERFCSEAESRQCSSVTVL